MNICRSYLRSASRPRLVRDVGWLQFGQDSLSSAPKLRGFCSCFCMSSAPANPAIKVQECVQKWMGIRAPVDKLADISQMNSGNGIDDSRRRGLPEAAGRLCSVPSVSVVPNDV